MGKQYQAVVHNKIIRPIQSTHTNRIEMANGTKRYLFINKRKMIMMITEP